MQSVDHMLSELKYCNASIRQLRQISSAIEGRLKVLHQSIGASVFGAIGSEIRFHHSDVVGVVNGKILRFEPVSWSPMPLCIVEVTIRGSKTTVHLANGEAIVRG